MMEPYGNTIFCDDIRDEVTGKKTYVGAYMGNMILPEGFPAVVPTFGLAITYLEPIDRTPKLTTIKVFVPGDGNEEQQLALDIDLPVDRFSNVKKEDIDPLARYYANLLHFRISPLVVTKSGYVKVRAYEEGKEYRLGSLLIRTPVDGEIS